MSARLVSDEKKKINIHKVVKCNVHIKLNRQREIEKHEKA